MRVHPSEWAARIDGLPRPVRWAIPVVLGCGFAVAHEPWVGNWPILLCLTVLFLALPASRRAAGWFAWRFGAGYFALTLRWIVEPFFVDPVRHGWMAPFAIVLMAGGLALFWAAAGWLARFVAQDRPSALLWFAAFLTAGELARGHLFSGFPWGLPAYMIVDSPWDVWLAWVGPYGTSGLIFGLCGVTALCLHRGWTLIWPGLVGVLMATLGLQFMTPHAPAPTDQTVRVIQPNAPQHQKWDRDWMGVFFERALAQTAADPPVDVVIWPETSVPTLLNYADPLLARMSDAARGAPVVAGIQRETAGDYYNSAIVIEGPTTVAEVYDKSHLVPFGEYIPLAWLLEPIGLGTLVEQVAGFSAGATRSLIDIDGLGLVRVLICYEGIFPEEIATGSARADVLLIITNDAWFGGGAGPRQHLVQAQARAIEQGVPVVRSANTGISAIIDARGRITGSLPLNSAGFVDAAVPAALPPTVYARIGDWPLTVLLTVCTLAGLVMRRRFDVDGPRARG